MNYLTGVYPCCTFNIINIAERYPMQNLLMMLAASGLFYTALSSSLYDMTVTACDSQLTNYELACKEINK